MDPTLARSVVDPLSLWMPPAVMVVLMLGFAFAWRGAQRKAELMRVTEENQRYATLKGSIDSLVTGFADMRVLVTGFVTVDRHSASVAALHEKINALALQVAAMGTK